MAFRDVNQQKLSYLLAQGTHEGELRKFFFDTKTQLVMKGARVQNLPHGREERIRAICERLPPKTDGTLRTWFQKSILVSDPMPLPDVLTYLELHFDADEVIPEADARLTARSALMYLFDDAPDQELISFLRRGPGVQPAQPDPGVPSEAATEAMAEIVPDTDKTQTLPGIQNYQLSELLASIIDGDEGAIDNALAPFPQKTQALVEALLRARNGDVSAANDQLAQFDPEDTESELVRMALNRTRQRRGPHSTQGGIRVVIPHRLEEYPNTENYDLVGFCAGELDAGAVFVRPIALVLGGQLHLLNREDRLRLFPESGDVMTHRSALRRPLRWRDIVRWKVAEREGAEGKIRFHMGSELIPPIEVLKVPVPSSDPDEVRDRIKAMASSGRLPVGQQAIFLLSDGLAVASPKAADVSREEAFAKPWQAWDSLETWLLEGHQYCLDLPQTAASHLDLSPLDTAFKNLLKNLEAAQKSTLNKTQKRELADLLRSHVAGEAASRARRVSASIEQVALDGEELETVLQLLNSREEVQQRVEELVNADFAQRQTEKSGLQAEIEALKRRKAELAKERSELERCNRKLAESAAASVRAAFSKAIDEGTTTLANAEVFRTLLGISPATTPSSSAPVTANSTASSMLGDGLTLPEVKERLTAFGLNARQAIVLAELSGLAMRSGVGFVLKGRGARQCAQVLARLDCEATGVIEIPMGLTSGAFVRQALDDMPDIRRLAILDADLSPVQVYGARLLDSLFESALTTEGNRPSLLFSCLGGDMSLPLPDWMQRVAVIVDLDGAWDAGMRVLDEIEVSSISLLAPLSLRILDELSRLESGYRDHVERALVTSLISEQ